MKKIFLTLLIINLIFSQKLLIPMDNTQNDHLKSYGFAYWILKQKDNIDWLLNYRGGSFLLDLDEVNEKPWDLDVFCSVLKWFYSQSKAAGIFANQDEFLLNFP